jgi:hypothetical protein
MSSTTSSDSRQRLAQHKSYDFLLEWEQGLAWRLIGSQERKLTLPFRADSKVANTLVVASESLCPGEQILVVVQDESLVDSWIDTWVRRGQLQVDGLTTQAPGPLAVTVTSLANLSAHEDDYRTRRYGVAILVGVGAGEDEYVTMAVKAGRYWKQLPQHEKHAYEDDGWQLGEAGRFLLDPVTWGLAERDLSAGPRLRLSPLAA